MPPETTLLWRHTLAVINGFVTAEATRRGLGARLLDKPKKLERLVAEIAASTPLPMTVKIRTGQNADKINVHKACLASQQRTRCQH